MRIKKITSLLLAACMILTANGAAVQAAQAKAEEAAESALETVVEATEESEAAVDSETEEESEVVAETDLEASTASNLNTFTDTYINPLYADVITEDDLLTPDEDALAASTELASDGYYTTVEEAAAYMREQLKARQETIVVKYKADNVDTSSIGRTIAGEAFKHTGAPTEGDYLKLQYGGWKSSGSYTTSGTTKKMTLNYTVTYYTTTAQESTVTAQLNSAMSSLNLNGKTRYQKVRAIYDYICGHTTYDYTNLNDDSYLLKYTAYAALVNGTSVCQGYAVLLYRMLLTAGIDCRVITGTGNGGNHAWNIIKLGNCYYDADATWDAGRSSYSYFLKIDSTFGDHTRGSDYTSTSFTSAYPMGTANYNNTHTHTYGEPSITQLTDEDGEPVMEFEVFFPCTYCGEEIEGVWDVESDVIREVSCTEDGLEKAVLRVWRTEADAAAGKDPVYVKSFGETVIEALGHNWNDGAVTKAATCSAAGETTYTCSLCSGTRTEEIAILAHTLVTDAAVAATCTTAGKTEGKHCSVCGTVTVAQTNVAAKGHTLVTDAAVAATCTTAGKTEGKHCSVCGTVTLAQTTVAAKGHTWNAGVVTTAPTGNTAGVRTYTCTVCGDTKTEEIAPTGIHVYDNGTVTKEATCTETGIKTFRCTEAGCTSSYTETIPAKGHTLVTDAAIEATCTTAGKTEGKHCSVCGTVTVAQTDIAAKGHTLVTDAAIEATCTTAGKTEGEHCSVCGTVTAAQTEIPAKGHSFTTYTYNSDATYTADGTETALCDHGCGATDTRTAVGTMIQLENPVLTKVSNTTAGVKVTWNPVEGAERYRIYYKLNDGKDTWHKSGESTAETYTVPASKLASGTSYRFTVRCITADGTAYMSSYDKYGLALTWLAPVMSTDMTLSNTCAGAKVSWKKIEGAEGYRIYRRTTDTTTYKQIGAVTGGDTLTYTDATAVSGTKYYYSVRAVKGTTLGSYLGKSLTYLAAVVKDDMKISNLSSGVKISWQAIGGAAGYYIYRKTSSAAAYVQIGSVTGGTTVTYTDSTAVNGTYYIYSVRAYSGTTRGSYLGKSAVRLSTVSISSLTNIATNKMVVKWAKNSQATGYQIRYSTGSSFASGTYTTVTVTSPSTLTKTISSLTRGKTYYVKVRSYKTVSGTKYYSGFSGVKSIKIAR